MNDLEEQLVGRGARRFVPAHASAGGEQGRRVLREHVAEDTQFAKLSMWRMGLVNFLVVGESQLRDLLDEEIFKVRRLMSPFHHGWTNTDDRR